MSMTEEKRFVLETVRTILFGVAAFAASLFIADKLRAESELEAFLQHQNLTRKQEVVDSLLDLNFRFSAAYMDKIQGHGDEQVLEQVYDDFRNSLNRARVYFSEPTDTLVGVALDELADPMRPLKDRRELDRDGRHKLRNLGNCIAESALVEIELRSKADSCDAKAGLDPELLESLFG